MFLSACLGLVMIALMSSLPAGAQTGKPVRIVVLGDSLTAGLGLPAQSTFPVKLQSSLKNKGIDAEISNAGVSGDTSSGGRDRLDWSVPDGTDAVILELGANDALRGIDPKLTRDALEDILKRLKARNIALELNPTSNVSTGVCTSFAAHPLRRYFDAGLLVTLNSDDPAFFGSDCANEYLLAHTEQSFTREELRQLATNSIRASFLPETEKQVWLSQIDSIA